MNQYLNPWYMLAETGSRKHAIMMHYGNGDKPNWSWWLFSVKLTCYIILL